MMIIIQDHPVILAIILSMILLMTAIINMVASEMQARRLNAHVQHAISVGFVAPRSPFAGMLGRLQWVGDWTRRFYAPGNLDHLRGMIQASGFNPHKMLPIVLGAKLTLTLLILLAGIFGSIFVVSFQLKIVTVGAGFMLGIMGPERVLGFIRNRFQVALQRGTPDALDLLVVCSEAGMGLESALERVAEEMVHSNRAISSVLFSLLDDLRVLPDQRDAFRNLGTRSGVDSLRRFGTMLSQSIQYGTPIGQVLRAVADELRRERMNKLEEMAIKLPAKLIFPLIFFIMPSLYIVLLGPSFLGLFDSMASASTASMAVPIH